MSNESYPGKRLAQLRNRAGYSQVQLAKKLNVSPSTIAMWELGEREIKSSTLIKLAEFFNVSILYLLGVEEDGKISDPDLEQLYKRLMDHPDEKEFLLSFINASQEQKTQVIDFWKFISNRK